MTKEQAIEIVKKFFIEHKDKETFLLTKDFIEARRLLGKEEMNKIVEWFLEKERG